MLAVAAPDEVAPELVQAGTELAPDEHVDARNEDIAQVFHDSLVALGEDEEVCTAVSAKLVGIIPTQLQKLTAEHASLLEICGDVPEKVRELAALSELIGRDFGLRRHTREHDTPVLEVGVEIGTKRLTRSRVGVLAVRRSELEREESAEVNLRTLHYRNPARLSAVELVEFCEPLLTNLGINQVGDELKERSEKYPERPSEHGEIHGQNPP